MPYVLHHPVKTQNGDFTNWASPAWAEFPLLQAYRIGAFDEAGDGPPTGGATLYFVRNANLTAALSDGAALIAANLQDNELDSTRRSIFESYFGVLVPADVSSARAAMVRCVGVDSHPDGILGPRPIVPHSDSKFRWVFQRGAALQDIAVPEKFNPSFNRDNSHFAGRSHILQVMRADACKAIRNGDIELGRKIAGFNAMKCGVKRSEVADFAKEFIGNEFPGIKPREPETRYDLTFTQGDSTTVTDFTELAGGWAVASNKLENDTPGVDVTAFIRYNNALSGPDHYVRCDMTFENAASRFAGPCARFSNSAVTCYAILGDAGLGTDGIFNFTSATSSSTLVSVATTFNASTYDSYLKCDGSSIYGYIGSSFSLAFTDTTYSETSFGLLARSLTTGTNHKFDNLTAEDFSGGQTVARLINGGRVHV